MDITNKAIEKAHAELRKLYKLYENSDVEALQAYIEKNTKPPKFDVFKETEYCIKALKAVRLYGTTLFVCSPTRGYTDELELIQSCVADLYRDKRVSLKKMDEVIERMKRLAPTVYHIEGIV